MDSTLSGVHDSSDRLDSLDFVERRDPVTHLLKTIAHQTGYSRGTKELSQLTLSCTGQQRFGNGASDRRCLEDPTRSR
jgi:hypothetical protein